MSETSELGTNVTGPLKGVRIIDLTSVVFGAYATQILGDYGADVIKVEAPSPTGGGGQGGDIMRWAGKVPDGAAHDLGPIFLTINRNKRSILLDLRKQSAVDALMKLVASADVLASNIRYEGMKRLGLSYEDVKKIKPDIVFVHAAGYGSDGPYAGLPAYDDLIQAGSGSADLLSRVDGDPKPRYVPTLMADKVSGLFMANAITAALFHRQRTGQGQFVEVPMFETITSFVLAEHFYGHVFDPATGPWSYGRVTNPDRRPYRTKNGYIGLLPYSDKQWDQFFELAGKPGVFKNDPRFATYKARTQNIRELYAMIEELTETKTTEEWLAALVPLSIPAVKMNRLDDLQDDPHLKAVEFFQRYEHPHAGPYFALRPPVRFGETPANIRRHPPRLGEQTREVLAEIGLDADAIDALEREGAVGPAPKQAAD
ncbi:MAG: CaiB/BaiF CoA-transferase family protein [Parvibaculum sp.]|uniref:CaiB/BaiF CoA transferase family protein n=1 Tax=Parvibaculum sp. TaxID=2024848 RepID=UPI00284CD33F|nr:CaiB/BaiF CoA-transferase family protein [Parvibaculum sp.]MDR3498455.1 CaiB/BaiF CoA-transferase family protein [Parvibaculum sp.]